MKQRCTTLTKVSEKEKKKKYIYTHIIGLKNCPVWKKQNLFQECEVGILQQNI